MQRLGREAVPEAGSGDGVREADKQGEGEERKSGWVEKVVLARKVARIGCGGDKRNLECCESGSVFPRVAQEDERLGGRQRGPSERLCGFLVKVLRFSAKLRSVSSPGTKSKIFPPAHRPCSPLVPPCFNCVRS